MKDQCERLQALGMHAVQFNSARDAHTEHQAQTALADGSARLVFLTATATDAVAKDIAGQLGLADMGVVRTGNYRPNLQLRVEVLTEQSQTLARTSI
jgi:superfamily II DNA helicase RecQ